MYIGTGYFDAQKGRFIDKKEHQKMKAEEPEFSAIKRLSKCFVCENEVWCNREEKSLKYIGDIKCDEFELDEDHLYYEVYKKQNNLNFDN